MRTLMVSFVSWLIFVVSWPANIFLRKSTTVRPRRDERPMVFVCERGGITAVVSERDYCDVMTTLDELHRFYGTPAGEEVNPIVTPIFLFSQNGLCPNGSRIGNSEDLEMILRQCRHERHRFQIPRMAIDYAFFCNDDFGIWSRRIYCPQTAEHRNCVLLGMDHAEVMQHRLVQLCS